MRRKPRRADHVKAFLAGQPGRRARVADIGAFVAGREGRDELSGPAISIAVRRENERVEGLGEPPAFRCYPEGEEWGWVALTGEPSEPGEQGLAARIRKRNAEVEQELGRLLAEMDWRTFESTFLAQVLEALGFDDVEITQATRDGGVDARVSYQRGLVQAQAIVSAKHWKGSVPVDEVRKVRGIKGPEDTAITITTGSFSSGAKKEAEPGQNQRAVYLIDGPHIVEICRAHGVGIRRVPLPDLLAIDEESFGSASVSPSSSVASADRASGPAGVERKQRRKPGRSRARQRRLRKEMLGDASKGLSAQEIAELTGLRVGAVRTYLATPDQRSALFAYAGRCWSPQPAKWRCQASLISCSAIRSSMHRRSDPLKS